MENKNQDLNKKLFWDVLRRWVTIEDFVGVNHKCQTSYGSLLGLGGCEDSGRRRI